MHKELFTTNLAGMPGEDPSWAVEYSLRFDVPTMPQFSSEVDLTNLLESRVNPKSVDYFKQRIGERKRCYFRRIWRKRPSS